MELLPGLVKEALVKEKIVQMAAVIKLGISVFSLVLDVRT